MIDKGVCNKGFIWNPSNCECECDNSCDIGEYLDYENFKCRNEVKLTKMTLLENENKYKRSSCTLYIVLFSVVFTINVGIGTYFVYYKYMNRNKETDRKEKFFRQQLLDAIYWTYKWDKSKN